jgi:hypothetical protein
VDTAIPATTSAANAAIINVCRSSATTAFMRGGYPAPKV